MAGDLTIYQGASLDVTFIARAGGSPVSLEGRDARMQVRKRIGTAVLLDLASTGVAPALTVEPDDATGVIKLHLKASQTKSLTIPRNEAVYDLLAYKTTDPDDVLLVAQGAVKLDRAVTVLD